LVVSKRYSRLTYGIIVAVKRDDKISDDASAAAVAVNDTDDITLPGCMCH